MFHNSFVIQWKCFKDVLHTKTIRRMWLCSNEVILYFLVTSSNLNVVLNITVVKCVFKTGFDIYWHCGQCCFIRMCTWVNIQEMSLNLKRNCCHKKESNKYWYLLTLTLKSLFPVSYFYLLHAVTRTFDTSERSEAKQIKIITLFVLQSTLPFFLGIYPDFFFNFFASDWPRVLHDLPWVSGEWQMAIRKKKCPRFIVTETFLPSPEIKPATLWLLPSALPIKLNRKANKLYSDSG